MDARSGRSESPGPLPTFSAQELAAIQKPVNLVELDGLARLLLWIIYGPFIGSYILICI
jgi:hypothetical protein